MAKKYMSDIHLEDYAGEYEEKKADCRDLVAGDGREMTPACGRNGSLKSTGMRKASPCRWTIPLTNGKP